MSSTVAPSGRFLMLSVRSTVLPHGTISFIVSTVGTGVIIPAFSTTFTGTSTSFVDPSLNVTSTLPVVLPGLLVSGASFSFTVAPSGRLSMLSVMSALLPLITSSSVTSGTNVSAIDFSVSLPKYTYQ